MVGTKSLEAFEDTRLSDIQITSRPLRTAVCPLPVPLRVGFLSVAVLFFFPGGLSDRAMDEDWPSPIIIRYPVRRQFPHPQE